MTITRLGVTGQEAAAGCCGGRLSVSDVRMTALYPPGVTRPLLTSDTHLVKASTWSLHRSGFPGLDW